jgi:hypothetical protein
MTMALLPPRTLLLAGVLAMLGVAGNTSRATAPAGGCAARSWDWGWCSAGSRLRPEASNTLRRLKTPPYFSTRKISEVLIPPKAKLLVMKYSASSARPSPWM